MMTDNKIITIIMITTTPPTTPPAATGTILTAVLPVLSINTMKITIDYYISFKILMYL